MIDEYIYAIPQISGRGANPNAQPVDDRPLPSLQKKPSKNNNFMGNPGQSRAQQANARAGQAKIT